MRPSHIGKLGAMHPLSSGPFLALHYEGVGAGTGCGWFRHKSTESEDRVMQIVIGQSEFRRLSPGTQKELLEHLAGGRLPREIRGRQSTELHWRKPVDLTTPMITKLLHGLSETQKKRLELFASKNGRATVTELLAVTGDTDWRTLSHFQAVLTRRLRRLIDDPDKKAEVIKWDFESTKWDGDGSNIVDGVYYVSPRTAQSLRAVLG